MNHTSNITADGKKTPFVVNIVLNLNGREVLAEALECAVKLTYPNCKTVVIDNGSADGSQEMVRVKFPSVVLVELGKNVGVMEGYNAGLRYGLEHGADWTFLLNNDIVFDANLLTELMNVALSDEHIGILAPKIYYQAEPNKFWYAGGNINYFAGIISHRGIREVDKGQYDRTEDTEYITGCAMLIKREVVEKIGMLDNAFSPMYSEDADFSIRTSRAGYRLVYVPQAKLWHKVSAFSGGGLTPLKTRLKVEHNFIIFKRYARWYHWLTIPWCIGFATLVFVLKEVVKGNFGIISALTKGFANILRRSKSY